MRRMKLTGTCPKCQGKRVVHLEVVADAGDWSGSGYGGVTTRQGGPFVPRQVLMRRIQSSGLFGRTVETETATGEVEAYACADCGYFEEYLKDPSRIPWKEIANAEGWTPPAGGGPYR
jgi:predicted nucleic-acid-binding Zn-ribbon protein